MATSLIGLGANIGDRAAALRGAIQQLREHPAIDQLAASSFRETSPVGGPGHQQPFLNAAVRLTTSLQPLALLELLQQLERQWGRRPDRRWAPRPLDLDLLLYDQLELDTPELQIPHPRMAYRRFVLEPAAEVAGSMIHPTIGWTVARLLEHLNSQIDYVAIAGTDSRLRRDVAEAVAARRPVQLLLSPLADGAAPAAGGTLDDLLRLLQRQAVQLQRLAPVGPLLSDFWLGQCLAEAAVRLPEPERQALECRWHELQSDVTPPKLLVWLRAAGGGPSTASGSEAARREAALRTEIQRLHQGPDLRLDAADPEWAVEEIVAAFEAMR